VVHSSIKYILVVKWTPCFAINHVLPVYQYGGVNPWKNWDKRTHTFAPWPASPTRKHDILKTYHDKKKGRGYKTGVGLSFLQLTT
jgi:hypothetical protein